MAKIKGKLGILGVGVMGQTLVSGMLAAKVLDKKNLWGAVKSSESARKLTLKLGIPVVTNYKKFLSNTDTLIICVKPSGLDDVLNELKKAGLKESTLIISIVAGKTISHMGKVLESKNPIIRAMPNTPCTVRQGMTVLTAGYNGKKSHLKTARSIFDSVGMCRELDEKHFNAITGLSGSGPAYMYLMMEALADGGVRVGLPRDAAMEIVTQTMLGAAQMVQQSGRHPAALRDDVTTPAGCTIGGLLIMEDGKIRSVLARAVEEAANIVDGMA